MARMIVSYTWQPVPGAGPLHDLTDSMDKISAVYYTVQRYTGETSYTVFGAYRSVRSSRKRFRAVSATVDRKFTVWYNPRLSVWQYLQPSFQPGP
jgi:hypothetical protein